jgi:dUTP pyrophosphatase
MKVQVINKSQWELPKYETLFSAGMDVRGDFSRIKLVDGKPEKFFFDADVVGIGLMEDPNSKGVVDKEGNYTGEKLPTIQVAKTIEIKPGGRCLIPTGLFVAIPQGYELQCRMRSGLALKMGLTLTNGIGTIDADYRGEIGIILTNTSNVPVRINDGERLMQLVLAKHEVAEWEEVARLDETERKGGFGHTGIN